MCVRVVCVHMHECVCFLSACLFLEGDGYLKGFFEKTANLSPAERADFLGDYEVLVQ